MKLSSYLSYRRDTICASNTISSYCLQKHSKFEIPRAVLIYIYIKLAWNCKTNNCDRPVHHSPHCACWCYPLGLLKQYVMIGCLKVQSWLISIYLPFNSWDIWRVLPGFRALLKYSKSLHLCSHQLRVKRRLTEFIFIFQWENMCALALTHL